ncbi:hypothetical protein HDV04_002458 [Boothiomyces sp. JEL0838]|nr:hypothetical protein HDV04_002458 [Boothiomyces sp. JEL0838]
MSLNSSQLMPAAVASNPTNAGSVPFVEIGYPSIAVLVKNAITAFFSMPPHSELGSENEGVFRIKLDPYVKDFQNQQIRNSTQLPVGSIPCNGVTDFVEKVWQQYGRKTSKEVIRNDDRSLEMSEESPQFEDMDKFIRFRKYNRYMLPSELSITNLSTFNKSDAPIVTVICKYSFNLVQKEDWSDFQQKFILPQQQDRAGAPTNNIVTDIEQRLHIKWDAELFSQGANWYSWAAYIASLPLYEHDSNILRPPPPHLVNRFTTVPTAPSLRLQTIHASTMAYSNSITDIKREIELLKAENNAVLELAAATNIKAQQTSNRITNLIDKLGGMIGITNGFVTSTRPDTSTVGIFADRIPDIADVDHM